MKSVVRITGTGKAQERGSGPGAALPAVEDGDAKVALIQALIPLVLQAVADVLEAAVTRLAGPRYSRAGGAPGPVRWRREQGSVYLLDQNLPITYQRVRDRVANVEVPLPSYQALQAPRAADPGPFRRILLGLSCRNYAACAEAVPAAFGLSASTVSRRSSRASAKTLAALTTRRLGGYDIVALVLDSIWDTKPGAKWTHACRLLPTGSDPTGKASSTT